jgi:hypothetical protein
MAMAGSSSAPCRPGSTSNTDAPGLFAWAGFDEMDEIGGSGSAELLDDGSLEIAFAWHLGDAAVLKAERAPPPAPR